MAQESTRPGIVALCGCLDSAAQKWVIEELSTLIYADVAIIDLSRVLRCDAMLANAILALRLKRDRVSGKSSQIRVVANESVMRLMCARATNLKAFVQFYDTVENASPMASTFTVAYNTSDESGSVHSTAE